MLRLTPNPTFTGTVSIPVPGDAVQKVEFVFNHRDRDGLKSLYEELSRKPDETDKEFSKRQDKAIKGIVAGWKKAINDEDEGLDTDYTPDALQKLLVAYPGAGGAIFEGFTAALTKGRVGN